jgi:hypothetical protein
VADPDGAGVVLADGAGTDGKTEGACRVGDGAGGGVLRARRRRSEVVTKGRRRRRWRPRRLRRWRRHGEARWTVAPLCGLGCGRVCVRGRRRHAWLEVGWRTKSRDLVGAIGWIKSIAECGKGEGGRAVLRGRTRGGRVKSRNGFLSPLHTF